MVTVVQDVVVALYTLQIIILDLLTVGVVRKKLKPSFQRALFYISPIFWAVMTACVRLVTPMARSRALICNFTVASDTPIS